MICDYEDFPNYFDGDCYSNDPAKNGIERFAGFGNDDPDLVTTPINPDYIIALCPGALSLQTSFINYADPADDTCMNYFLCMGTNEAGDPPTSAPTPPTPHICAGTLLFDRNFGRCTLPDKAPCGTINASPKPDCSCGTDLPIPDCTIPTFVQFPKSCVKYALCYDGKMVAENECADGLQFNPHIQECDRVENIKPECTYALLSSEKIARIPRAQPKSRNVNPLIPQLRQILMNGLRY